MLPALYRPRPVGLSNAAAGRQTSPGGEIQPVKKPFPKEELMEFPGAREGSKNPLYASQRRRFSRRKGRSFRKKPAPSATQIFLKERLRHFFDGLKLRQVAKFPRQPHLHAAACSHGSPLPAGLFPAKPGNILSGAPCEEHAACVAVRRFALTAFPFRTSAKGYSRVCRG